MARDHSSLKKANDKNPAQAVTYGCRTYRTYLLRLIHMPCLCHSPPCHALRESPRVVGKTRTVNRATPRGSRKKPNLGTSPTGRTDTMPLCMRLLKATAQRARGRAWHGTASYVWNQTRSHCDIQMVKAQTKSLSTRHGRDTAWYVWISLYVELKEWKNVSWNGGS